MRAELLTAVQGLTKATLGTFSVVTDLPWTADGNPLYLKNLKRIYVGLSETTQESIIDTLDGGGFATETATTQVVFACDAKQLPANYDTLKSAIEQLRLDFDTTNWNQRRTTVSTEFEADTLITTLEFAANRVVQN